MAKQQMQQSSKATDGARQSLIHEKVFLSRFEIEFSLQQGLVAKNGMNQSLQPNKTIISPKALVQIQQINMAETSQLASVDVLQYVQLSCTRAHAKKLGKIMP